MKKEDLRITKTKRDLRTALLELLKIRSFEKISVSDICSEAMVNRMTFYKHFDDKYDLLNNALNAIVGDILKKNSKNFTADGFADDPVGYCTSLVTVVLDECVERVDLIQAMIANDSGIVHDLIINSVRKDIEKLIRSLDEIAVAKYPISALSSFITGGASYLIYYCVTHQNEYSREQYAKGCTKFLTELLTSGVFFENPLK